VERIKEAISKAKAQRDSALPSAAAPVGARNGRPVPNGVLPDGSGHPWALPLVQLDAAHLERHRIVSYARTDPSHVAFNLLRTKVHQTMKDGNWTTLAVTSPSAGCGKTMVAVNLAFSLARQTDCRTVLIDLDLKKSSVARTLGIRPMRSIADYLAREADLADCFVAVEQNLSLGLNAVAVENSAEMMLDDLVGAIIPAVTAGLQPNVIIFDLPPMLASDDAIAFLPQVDCAILIAAAGTTTSREIVECEEQLVAATNFLGVVVNKCADKSETYYQTDSS
jgi:Mrp family chromosome partitioning ATPase